MYKGLKKGFVLLVCMVCVMMYAGVAAAMSFSADMVTCYNGKVGNSKIYMTAEKVRLEPENAPVSIVRMDKKVVWLLMKDRRYMEHAFNPASIKDQNPDPSPEPTVNEVERVFLGKETINNYICDKYKITMKDKTSYYIWLSSDPGIMIQVRISALDGSWWKDLRNISLSEPDPGMFEIPAGYTKIGMPGLMGLFGG